ncbi:MAG: ParB/RepB/Spo0J family partition protein [Nitrososphaera sp.]|jgi:ParB family chromosome partitioning protein
MPYSAGLASSIPGIIGDVMLSKIKYSEKCLRPRSDVRELVDSIRENGLLQPIVVRPKNDYFEIVAGNRRCMACELLRWRKIPCHIVELDDKRAFEYSLVENIQRQTLTVVEEANAFKVYVADFGWGGVSELARRIGKSPSYITRRINLLNLPPDVISSITNQSLSASLAEELCSIKDQSRQSELASLIIQRHLSLRKARGILSQYKAEALDDTDDKSTASRLEHKRKVFDKMIVTLRIALNNIGALISQNEDDWLMREILMQHKNSLHSQIDLLIKEKRKLSRRLVAGVS